MPAQAVTSRRMRQMTPAEAARRGPTMLSRKPDQAWTTLFHPSMMSSITEMRKVVVTPARMVAPMRTSQV